MLLSKKEREFRKSYNDYYPVILNALYYRVGNREDAEDICHEIFVNYYRKFDEVRDARSWLIGAMRFSIYNYYRQREVSGMNTVDIAAIEEDVHLAFENGFRDIRIIINDVIADDETYKDDVERILFDLIAISDYTYTQAARHLGLTTRQATYKYQQVSRRILERLKERGIAKLEDLL